MMMSDKAKVCAVQCRWSLGVAVHPCGVATREATVMKIVFVV